MCACARVRRARVPQIIVRTPSGRLQIITNLLGSHNASNVLAAVATGVALKAPLQSIVAGVEAVEVPGRCVRAWCHGGGGFVKLC